MAMPHQLLEDQEGQQRHQDTLRTLLWTELLFWTEFYLNIMLILYLSLFGDMELILFRILINQIITCCCFEIPCILKKRRECSVFGLPVYFCNHVTRGWVNVFEKRLVCLYLVLSLWLFSRPLWHAIKWWNLREFLLRMGETLCWKRWPNCLKRALQAWLFTAAEVTFFV